MAVPLVSIVMSVFDAAPFLRDAIDSMLGQSFRDFEFIIINDGSTDGSAAVLDAYQQLDPRVRLLHQENRGLVASLNRGCDLARGQYIARMDADDIALPDRLARQLEFMEVHSDVGAVGGAVRVIDASGRVVGGLRFPTKDRDIRKMLSEGGCALSHPTVLMRAQVIKSLGGYRPLIIDAEDYDLWLRIADRSQLRNLDEDVLKYRRHCGQVSVKRFCRQALGNIAARTAAEMRKKGEGDPLDHADEITPALLTSLGVSDTAQQAARDRAQLCCIASMIEVGEYARAREVMAEMCSKSAWRCADSSIVADYHLLMARLHWRQGRLATSILSASHAALTRPILLARPLKPVLRRIGVDLRFDVAERKARMAFGRGEQA